MYQQASCSCNSEKQSKITLIKENHTTRFAEIVDAMLTAILIKNTAKSDLKAHDDLQSIVNELSFITQNLR